MVCLDHLTLMLQTPKTLTDLYAILLRNCKRHIIKLLYSILVKGRFYILLYIPDIDISLSDYIGPNNFNEEMYKVHFG